MTRIKITDLPLLEDLTPEQLKELFGAGRVRPVLEQLEDRLVRSGMSFSSALTLSAPVNNMDLHKANYAVTQFVDVTAQSPGVGTLATYKGPAVSDVAYVNQPGRDVFSKGPGVSDVAYVNQPGRDVFSNPITVKWISMPDSTGVGNAVGPEQTLPDGVGRFQDYEGGTIYYSARTGAHYVQHIILETWNFATNGYPINDTTVNPDGSRFNNFEHGTISWSPGPGLQAPRPDPVRDLTGVRYVFDQKDWQGFHYSLLIKQQVVNSWGVTKFAGEWGLPSQQFTDDDGAWHTTAAPQQGEGSLTTQGNNILIEFTHDFGWKFQGVITGNHITGTDSYDGNLSGDVSLKNYAASTASYQVSPSNVAFGLAGLGMTSAAADAGSAALQVDMFAPLPVLSAGVDTLPSDLFNPPLLATDSGNPSADVVAAAFLPADSGNLPPAPADSGTPPSDQAAAPVAPVADLTNVSFAMASPDGSTHQLVIVAQTDNGDGTASISAQLDGQSASGLLSLDAAGNIHITLNTQAIHPDIYFAGVEKGDFDGTITGQPGQYHIDGTQLDWANLCSIAVAGDQTQAANPDPIVGVLPILPLAVDQTLAASPADAGVETQPADPSAMAMSLADSGLSDPSTPLPQAADPDSATSLPADSAIPALAQSDDVAVKLDAVV